MKLLTLVLNESKRKLFHQDNYNLFFIFSILLLNKEYAMYIKISVGTNENGEKYIYILKTICCLVDREWSAGERMGRESISVKA